MKRLAFAILLVACSRPRVVPASVDATVPDVVAEPVPVEAPSPMPETRLLGHYETEYDVIDKLRTRAQNIEAAAKKLDVELGAGEIWSFNDTVGIRDEANGFLSAPVIFMGRLTDDIGGGVCQVASTVHAAARFAKLQIVDRRPHSRISKYISPGLDATVAYPPECKEDPKCDKVDLKIQNAYTSAVKLSVTATVEGTKGIVKASFWGIESAYSAKYTFNKITTEEASKKLFVRVGTHRSANYRKQVQSSQSGYFVRSKIEYASVEGGGADPLSYVSYIWTSRYAPVDEVWEVGLNFDADAGLPWEPRIVDAGAE